LTLGYDANGNMVEQGSSDHTYDAENRRAIVLRRTMNIVRRR
jgi:hypothetical protein